MGKGSRNRDYRGIDKVDAPQKYKTNKKRKGHKSWLKPAISIAIAVVLVLGIVAGVMLSNGTFRRMQILVKSQTGEFDVNRQVATFLAWELEYYSAYIDYQQTSYTDPDSSILTQYSNAETFALDYATARVTDDIVDANGVVISTPRDAIENTLSYMINFVAVCDYAYGERGITVEDGEWEGNFTITWLAGMEAKLPVSWNDLREMQVTYGFASMDLFLDTFFGHGLNSKDVESALKLIALYEKYMSIYMEEVENGITDPEILEYILSNPNYFYTSDYVSYTTTNKDLKDKLESAATLVDFNRIITEDWFNDGGYKDIYNQFVTLKKAEADYDFIEDKVDNDNGTAWTDAITQIGAEKVTYQAADKDDENKIPSKVSKWIFATRKQFDDNMVVTDDKIYVISVLSVQKDENSGEVTSITVYQKTYDMVEGESHEGDDNFKATVLAHLLAKKEYTDVAAPAVGYKTAIMVANAYKDQWIAEGITEEELTKENGVMESVGKLTHKENCVSSTTSVPSVIRDAIFKADTAPEEKSFLTVELDDTTAYIVYLKELVKDDGGETAGVADAKWDLYYVEVESDVFYQILEQVIEEAEDALPDEKSEAFNASPTPGSYQEWLFKDANRDNNFASPIAVNDKKVIETTKTGADGQPETSYTVYILVRGLHLDDDNVVDGGYYIYTGTDTNEVFEALKDKTGADLIAALQGINAAEGKTNNAVVSDTITDSGLDENLADWLFSDERVANEYSVITGKNGKTYVAVYLSHEEMWDVMGRIYLTSERVNNWLASRTAEYKANERVLNRIGDPTPVATNPVA